MILHYVLPNGEQRDFKLGKDAVTIGRSADADLAIVDKMVSRIHCGISFWNDAYFLRDFKSRNGTFVNDCRIDVVKLRVGDRIRIGSTIILVDSKHQKGTETLLKEIKQELDRGKGYNTMLKEIVRDEKQTKQ